LQLASLSRHVRIAQTLSKFSPSVDSDSTSGSRPVGVWDPIKKIRPSGSAEVHLQCLDAI
jgi:hypothetical protein